MMFPIFLKIKALRVKTFLQVFLKSRIGNYFSQMDGRTTSIAVP
jgi:hypothetical protein